MSSGRILSAGIVGGVVMFVWGAVDHMVLPFGKMGIKRLPNETTLLPQLGQAMRERGFYFFPGMDEGEMSEAAQKAWAEKIRRGPQGIVIFDPRGSEPFSMAQLGTELLSNILAALILAVVLATTRLSRAGRTVAAAALGAFAWMSIDVSYWNWYRFPSALAAASLIEQGVGWLLAGLTIALVLGRARTSSGPAAAGS